jgi:hypothetical protein
VSNKLLAWKKTIEGKIDHIIDDDEDRLSVALCSC